MSSGKAPCIRLLSVRLVEVCGGDVAICADFWMVDLSLDPVHMLRVSKLIHLMPLLSLAICSVVGMWTAAHVCTITARLNEGFSPLSE